LSSKRRWALPLVPLYAAGLAVKDGLRAVGLSKVKKLQWPVVSVGSLSAGGAGKTPVVIALAKLLRERGWDVAVLSRGYGRSGIGVEQVGDTRKRQVPVQKERRKNQATIAKRFGDEPVMIARAAGVPVWVGADRFEAGMRAEEFAARREDADTSAALRDYDGKRPPLDGGSSRGVHVLDDGFQHRQLARHVDVVLITAEDLRDSLLPGGNLREPLRALRRADAIVIRQEEWTSVAPRVRELMREGTPMWSIERTLRFPTPLGIFSAGLRPVAFCAIARPEGFAEMLNDAGCGVVEMIVFGDHHGYTVDGIETIIKVAKSLNASGFVTTEKDAVKLSAEMRERLETVGPLTVIGLETEFLNTAEVMSELEERLV
jgi:tetraacyldisaccharide 4'-kinase